jgi:hypothetical protein
MQQFLDCVAQHALGAGRSGAARIPLVPLHARSFLVSLANRTFENAEFIVGNLRSLVARPAKVSRATRAASVALAPILMLGLTILTAGVIRFDHIRSERAWKAAHPGQPALRTVAELYESAIEAQSPTNNHDAELTRAFLVEHFSAFITNDEAWSRPELRDHLPAATRSLLKQAVIGHLPPKPADLDEAARVLPERIEQQERLTRLEPIWIGLCGGIALGLVFALLELAGTMVFCQSPLLRLFGLAVVDRAGQPARRLRLLGRWLLTCGVLAVAGLIAVISLALAVAVRWLPVNMGNFPAPAVSVAWTLGLSVTGLCLAASVSPSEIRAAPCRTVWPARR